MGIRTGPADAFSSTPADQTEPVGPFHPGDNDMCQCGHVKGWHQEYTGDTSFLSDCQSFTCDCPGFRPVRTENISE